MMPTWSIGILSLLTGATVAGCGVSATGTGLSPAFAEAARDAREYIKTEMIPVGRMPQFPAALAEARAIVKDAETKIGNDADRGVWLVLNMINTKANETRRIYELEERTGRRAPATIEALKEVVNERTLCLTELEGWLSNDVSKVPELQRGTCLRLAKQAAAILAR